MIRDIRERFHEGCLGKNEKGKGGCGDVLLVAHGHILRAFAMRWIGRELTEGVGLILEGMHGLMPTYPHPAYFCRRMLYILTKSLSSHSRRRRHVKVYIPPPLSPQPTFLTYLNQKIFLS